MKVRSKQLLLALAIHLGAFAFASAPGNKRTVLTSGETVYPIRFQLGQSTVVFFGFKPETVICGNKNYFNIEKIKDGITIQPLANFATNLTVMNGNKRFLFYLTPSRNQMPDAFIDVKWIPPSQITPVRKNSKTSEVVKALSQSAKLSGELEFKLVQQKSFTSDRREIIEFQLKNLSGKRIKTSSVEVVVFQGGTPTPSQVMVWERDAIESQASAKGRLIFSGKDGRNIFVLVGYKQKTTKLVISRARY